MVPRVNIIGKSNGVGLDRDVRLLSVALEAAGCEVVYTPTGTRQSGRRKSLLFKMCWRLQSKLLPRLKPAYDVNVMLEHVWTQYLPQGRVNVLVPNPDFFDRHDVAALPQVDRVWAKTRQAARLFSELGAQVLHVGFDSEDRLMNEVPRQRTFFHLAGSSLLKGTQHLLKVWAGHPEWPMLIVAGRLKFKPPSAANIRVHGGYLSDDFLRRLQNESCIHLCTSEAEGWGHYLVEAMSVGAAVITVDAPPMNELVHTDRGWLLSCRENGKHRLVPRYIFDELALIALVNRIVKMPDEALDELGARGRKWFLDNREHFLAEVRRVVDDVVYKGADLVDLRH